MTPKSNNLFHFTKSLDFLKGILSNGLLPRFSLEDTRYLGPDYLAYPMTCFCDIPIGRISEHTAFYGAYGIGLTKEWGLRNGLAPLIYTPPSGVVVSLANYLLMLDMQSDKDDIREAQNSLNEHFLALIPFIKPTSGNMVVAGKVVEKDFYQENEWRYVPKDAGLLDQDEFDKERDAKNKEMETFRLQFVPGDVRYIFVQSDAEIPIIFDFLQHNLGHFPLNDIKILATRITSLETLAKDL